MNRLKAMNRTTRTNYLTYILVIAAYVILEVMLKGGGLKAATKGMLNWVSKPWRTPAKWLGRGAMTNGAHSTTGC